jgi:c-di-GMP-binding flagellar brake protein YcgR
MSLQPITADAIPLGEPLPWAVFDGDGHRLYEPGDIVSDRLPLEDRLLFVDMEASPEVLRTLSSLADKKVERDLPVEELFPPSGIKPQVWDRFQVRLPSSGDKFLIVHLIGYVQDHVLLITPPRNGGTVAVREGDRVALRALTGSNIYTFESEVLRLAQIPAPHLHLRFPAKVMRQRLRRAPWARVSLTARVSAANGAPVDGVLSNLSACGAHVSVHEEVGGKGDVLRLDFELECGTLPPRRLSLEATVRHKARIRLAGGAGEMLEYGVEFLTVPEKNLIWLKCVVYQRIAEGFLA